MSEYALVKPQAKDLFVVEEILSQWNDDFETKKYLQRIKNEIEGRIEFDMRFWIIKVGEKIVGIGGLADCQPKLDPFIQTDKPKELKTICLDGHYRGKGCGRKLVESLQNKAVKLGYKELLLVSAEQYKETAYGFYQKLGFKQVGEVVGRTDDKKMAVFSKLLVPDYYIP